MKIIDGLVIKCGTLSLWVSKDGIEDMLKGKLEGCGTKKCIEVRANYVEVEDKDEEKA